jgi:hypothetical protein
MPQWVVELLASWKCQFGSHRNIKLWRMVPLCLMRCIWQESNAQNLGNCENSVIELKSFMFKSLYA